MVECYVSLADFTESATDKLGLLLSTSPISGSTDGVLLNTPQVVASSTITDTQGWVHVVDTIIVTEAYVYLTIGNFNSDVATMTTPNPTYSAESGTYGAYYFVDDVRVMRVISNPTAGLNQNGLGQVNVYPNPFTDQIKIELPDSKDGFEVQLLNAQGKLLVTKTVFETELFLQMDAFPAGVYILSIKNETGIFTKRLIK